MQKGRIEKLFAIDTLAATASLDVLAERIRTEHASARADFNSGIRHAMAAGEMLIAAKELVPHGGWLPWLRDHCDISVRTAQRYMQAAQLRDLLEPNASSATHLTIEGVIRELTAPKSDPVNVIPEPGVRLHAAGGQDEVHIVPSTTPEHWFVTVLRGDPAGDSEAIGWCPPLPAEMILPALRAAEFDVDGAAWEAIPCPVGVDRNIWFSAA